MHVTLIRSTITPSAFHHFDLQAARGISTKAQSKAKFQSHGLGVASNVRALSSTQVSYSQSTYFHTTAWPTTMLVQEIRTCRSSLTSRTRMLVVLRKDIVYKLHYDPDTIVLPIHPAFITQPMHIMSHETLAASLH